MPSLVALAEDLLAQTKQLDSVLKARGVQQPSFDNDPLDELPEDVQRLRKKMTDTSHVIRQLAQGPKAAGLEIAFNWTDQLVLHIIWRYGLASAVPLTGSASYDEIAATAKLNRSAVVRTIRAAIPLNIFDELGPGRVRHTALSRYIAEDEGFNNVIGLQVHDLGPASTKLIESWGPSGDDSGEPDDSAFSLWNGGRPLFKMMSDEPQLARRFNLAMKYSVEDRNFNLADVAHAFDWQTMDRPGARLIDLGGGYGQVSQSLTQHTQHLKFTVQDLPHVIEEGRQKLSPELQSRISFEACNFLQAQPSDDPPSAFLISRCLHNWSDHHCSQILRALIPALRQGSKVLIWDVVLDDEPVRNMSDRFNLQQDFIMATISNGKDRSLGQFKQLLIDSDDRFRLDGVRRVEGCMQSMVVVTWETHSAKASAA